MPTRDEYSNDTKDIVAKRVGLRCSNPNCRRPTSGPQTHPRKTVNIGVAAHITDPAWREKLDTVVDILRAIRSRYDLAIKEGTLRVGHDDGTRQWYSINDHARALWMDETRAQPSPSLPISASKQVCSHPAAHTIAHHAGKPATSGYDC